MHTETHDYKRETQNERSGLDDGAKKRFDALAVLEQGQWKEFENKVTHEWRLSFAIWTSIVASSGAILGGKVKFGSQQSLFGITPTFAAVAIIVAIIILHGWFLLWIQSSLQKIRDSLWEVRQEMEWIAKGPSPEGSGQRSFHRNKYKQASMYVQVFISILLGGIFVWVVSIAP